MFKTRIKLGSLNSGQKCRKPVFMWVSVICFTDGYWYKFTKKNVTKENAIMKITEVCGFATDSIIAFGDDYADIGMLELCGTGVAMGNAIDEVKKKQIL